MHVQKQDYFFSLILKTIISNFIPKACSETFLASLDSLGPWDEQPSRGGGGGSGEVCVCVSLLILK